jgi:hypothetical protein
MNDLHKLLDLFQKHAISKVINIVLTYWNLSSNSKESSLDYVQSKATRQQTN